jgi:GntR family transcriptional regulator
MWASRLFCSPDLALLCDSVVRRRFPYRRLIGRFVNLPGGTQQMTSLEIASLKHASLEMSLPSSCIGVFLLLLLWRARQDEQVVQGARKLSREGRRDYMATQGSDHRPKYQRIADALRDAIQAGEYGPGDRLPGENDLMTTYSVARMTARQALGVLLNEGLAESRKGAGVFVRAFRPLRRRGIERLAHDQWGSGRSIWSADIGDRTLVVDQVSVSEQEAPQHIADILGVGSGEFVCVRSRRFVLDGKPVLLSISYLPAALVVGSAITQRDTGPGGTYARLAELGYRPVHFREEIRCRMPSQVEASRLSLSLGTPVIIICRTTFDDDGRTVEVNEMTLDSASYVLEYDFDA